MRCAMDIILSDRIFMAPEWIDYTVVSDPKEILKLLSNNPFNYRRSLSNLKIDDDSLLEITDRVREELKKGGPRGKGFRRVVGDLNHVGVADIRIGDENAGKRNGYRVFVLIVPQLKKAFVLEIKKHLKDLADTNVSNEEKEKLRQLISSITD